MYKLIILLVALSPLVTLRTGNPIQEESSVSFKHIEEIRGFNELPLSTDENRFYRNFPGKIKRYTDGRDEIIVRIVTSPTRKLHPAQDCFRGTGFSVKNQKIWKDNAGDNWTQFIAKKENKTILVKERIFDFNSSQSWCDVSAWYWAATMQNNSGPWVALTIAKTIKHS